MGRRDEAAFLSAIRAGDETARLVFADWLDDRGDPRAPWVRDPDIWPFMAPGATDPVPRLLGVPDPVRRWELLRRLGVASVPSLLDCCQPGPYPPEHGRPADAVLFRDALIAIAGFGSAAVPALVAAIDSGTTFARHFAKKALGAVACGEPLTARPALLALVRHPNPAVRAAAAGVMPRLPDTEVITVLVAALADESIEVRTEAAGTLGEIAAAVPALVSALQGGSAEVRSCAARALGRIGRPAAEAAPALVAALRDAEVGVRVAAVQALLPVDPDRCAIPALVAALGDPHKDVWMTASRLLGVQPSVLNAATDNSEWWARHKDGLRIGVLGGVDELVGLLREGEARARRTAARLLGLITPIMAEGAVPDLVLALRDEVTDVRHAAAWALGRIGPDAIEAETGLTALVERDPEAVAREAARTSLGQIVAARA